MTQADQNNSVPTITDPPRRSPWSKKALIVRMVWAACELFLWKPSPAWAWGFRSSLLRLFGAQIGKQVRIHPSVKVVIPWNIEIGDYVRVHERAILYALGEITIGEHSEIGPLVYICAGTHDFSDPAFTLLREPIIIGSRCLLGTASFVAPNITLADGTVLMPRCAMYTNSLQGECYQGNPGKLYDPSRGVHGEDE
ncbi:MAG: hypothetical protein JKX70_02130 [Phycisphaerales bacterium]|nr:hypothetical protein [Phycisphaerales bacterium]